MNDTPDSIFPHFQTRLETTNTQVNTTLIASPGPNKRLVIDRFVFANDASTKTTMSLASATATIFGSIFLLAGDIYDSKENLNLKCNENEPLTLNVSMSATTNTFSITVFYHIRG